MDSFGVALPEEQLAGDSSQLGTESWSLANVTLSCVSYSAFWFAITVFIFFTGICRVVGSLSIDFTAAYLDNNVRKFP
jgi:hypothetical protein